ncbi:MAG: phosphotransferase [Nitrospirae bacterium]|nr:phosphotransferase [Nitrospirota bacterium]
MSQAHNAVKVLQVNASIISTDALKENILPLYDFSGHVKCELLFHNTNDIYLISDGNRKYYMKLFGYGGKSGKEIDDILYLIENLGKNEICVSLPLTSKDGKKRLTIEAPEGRRSLVIFDGLQGERLNLKDMRQVYEYGRTVALLHNCCDNDGLKLQSYHLNIDNIFTSPIEYLQNNMYDKTGYRDFLAALADRLRKQIAQLPMQSPMYGICHGDLNLSNVLWSNTGNVMLMDFDDCCRFWRIYDLSVFLWNLWALIKNSRNRKRLWNTYIDGYRQQRNLSRTELKMIPVFLFVRHFEFISFNLSTSKHFGTGWFDVSFFDKHIDYLRKWEKEYSV